MSAKRTRTFVDIDPTFAINRITNDVSVKIDERAISFAIKNLILTRYGERPFQPILGSPVSSLLFDLEGPNLEITLKEAILQTIINYEPRVEILGVYIKNMSNTNSLDVTINYRIKNTSEPRVVTVTLDRTR